MATVVPIEQDSAPLDEFVDLYRIAADRRLDPLKRASLGQYLTPTPIARFMASLFKDTEERSIRLLDPGAGIGSLTVAWLLELLKHKHYAPTINITCYEIDPLLVDYLNTTLEHCRELCETQGIQFNSRILRGDFIYHGTELIARAESLFNEAQTKGFTHCIINPPYKKIHGDSPHRKWLRSAGIETGNLYAGFLAIAIKLLAPKGQLVAIVPRSFCNGPYFKPFRDLLLDSMALNHLHVFDSRDQAFKDNQVLQENVIFHAIKGGQQKSVRITTSLAGDFDSITERDAPFEQVVRPNDPQRFIHIAAHDLDQNITDNMRVFTHSLAELGLSVSTGPVVDFRLQKDILAAPEAGAVPLIYSAHFVGNKIAWPNSRTKKPNAILESDESRRWLMPNGWYTLTKRFSAKEEKRRVVAVVYDPACTQSEKLGIENHLNVFHQHGRGLNPALARGLAAYLNSTLVDLYFRQFNGHTQVNAADLRTLPYPSAETLQALGTRMGESSPAQEQIDDWLNGVIEAMSKKSTSDPARVTRKLSEALTALQQLGFPRAQQNDRSALTLLALLDLTPRHKWSAASSPMIGITPIMDFCKLHYGRNYAPNTRETFRRQTMHQFVQAGLAVENPDDPTRPINSPNWVYQIAPGTLKLLKVWGTKTWDKKLTVYLTRQGTLAQMYAKERRSRRVPVAFRGKKLALTAGRHNELIKQIVEIFAPQFVSGSRVLYIGDTGAKMVHFDEPGFRKLGLHFDSHGKFPDVVFYYPRKKWLLLVEAVTSHGPVNPKRHVELKHLFSRNKAGLVYVTAFPDRHTAARYLPDISWETEVWVAENPTHLIHFDGERFLGPY